MIPVVVFTKLKLMVMKHSIGFYLLFCSRVGFVERRVELQVGQGSGGAVKVVEGEARHVLRDTGYEPWSKGRHHRRLRAGDEAGRDGRRDSEGHQNVWHPRYC